MASILSYYYNSTLIGVLALGTVSSLFWNHCMPLIHLVPSSDNQQKMDTLKLFNS